MVFLNQVLYIETTLLYALKCTQLERPHIFCQNSPTFDAAAVPGWRGDVIKSYLFVFVSGWAIVISRFEITMAQPTEYVLKDCWSATS